MSYSIGIPCFNEQSNICNLLNDIAKLNNPISNSFWLTEVLISDGHSTDGTINSVKDWTKRNEKIKLRLFEHEQRVGKFQNLNLIFSRTETDVLVCIDADVRLTRYSMERLLSNFNISPECEVVWGSDVPSISDIKHRASAFQMNLENRKRLHLPRQAIYAAGVFFALKRSVFSRFRFSPGLIADDIALADFVNESHITARQDPTAAVIATPAGNLRDFYLQTYRGFEALKIRRANGRVNFSYVPESVAIVARFEEFKKDPFGATLCSIYKIGAQLYHFFGKERFSDAWPIAYSTKSNLS
jgi:glycosyltransferase involved in cell wall biosynthesis